MILFWILVIICILGLIILVIIVNIKKTIYVTLNQNIDIEYDATAIYPNNFNCDTFNVEIFKYLVSLLIMFKKTLSNISYEKNVYYLYFSKTKIAKLILDNNNNLWIVVRGTLTYNEFEHDLRISQVNVTNEIMCHNGFYEIYNNIKSDLFNILQFTKPNKIFCIGHSLGGGILTVAAYDLISLFDKDICIYIVGTPKTCNKALSLFLQTKNFYNIQNMSDIYVNIIPSVLPFYNNITYSNVGKLILFDQNYNNVIINHMIETYALNIHEYKYLMSLF